MGEKEMVRPFSNGIEYWLWREHNCDRCCYDYEPGTLEVKCVMEEAVSMASVTDGMIQKNYADRMGLPFSEVGRTCKEFDHD